MRFTGNAGVRWDFFQPQGKCFGECGGSMQGAAMAGCHAGGERKASCHRHYAGHSRRGVRLVFACGNGMRAEAIG